MHPPHTRHSDSGALAAAAAIGLAVLLAAPDVHAAPFVRGDTDGNTRVEVTDGVRIFGYLFLGVPASIACEAALDANDDGEIEVSDGIFVLEYLFLGGPAPAAPFPGCGPAAEGGLGCERAAGCEGNGDCEDVLVVAPRLAEGLPRLFCVSRSILQVVQLIVTICPDGESRECGAGDPPATGCPVTLSTLELELDLAQARLVVHVAGEVVDAPVGIADPVLGGATTCVVDLPFQGDVVVPLTLAAGGEGVVVLAGFGEATFENVELSLSAEGGDLCTLLESAQGLFTDDLLEQIAVVVAEITAELEAAAVGTRFCAS